MIFENEIANIFRLKLPFDNIYTSVFLIKTETGNVLVDCGTTKRDVDEWLVPALLQAKTSVTDIKYLVLFSHAYEPWNKDGAIGRNEVEKCLQDCKKYVERREE